MAKKVYQRPGSVSPSLSCSSTTSSCSSIGEDKMIVEYRHSYHSYLEINHPILFNERPVPDHRDIEQEEDFHFASLYGDHNDDLGLLDMDPHHWKKLDIYHLLGLGNKRYFSTPLEIKNAYRARCLQYHPDKLRTASRESQRQGDDIFKCIFQAHVTISNPEKKKSFDSVDKWAFNASIPSLEEAKESSEDLKTFLRLFGPVFRQNARFSRTQPVPHIGNKWSTREEVEGFYSFWASFESWRIFDFLDEDETEHAENRDAKRFLEKKNKAARIKRKNEDNIRLRDLHEMAFKFDPRLIAYRQEDRRRKEEEKEARLQKNSNTTNSSSKTSIKQPSPAELEKEKILLQAKLEDDKKSKEEEKNKAQEIKKDKKALKKVVVSENCYFVSNLTDLPLITKRTVLFEKYLSDCADLKESLKTLESLIANTSEKDSIFDLLLASNVESICNDLKNL